MKKSRFLLISVTLLPATLKMYSAEKPLKPNIIFILCDDMGYGDLGCYGQKYIQTPNLDRMAQEGMRFTQAYAGSPVSAPSRAALMTGQHSGHGHVRGNKEYWPQSPVMKYGENKDWSIVGQEPYDANHVILPEIMKIMDIRPACSENGQVVTKVPVPLPTSVAWMNITVLSASSRPICIIRIF